jgi:nucleotide-binding universal stress UspA family protein
MEGHMNILVATDGSETALDAARRSIDLLRPGAHVVLVTVIPEREDPQDDAGGFEGPVISEKEAEKDWKETTAAGKAALDRTASVLGTEVEVRLVPDGRGAGAVVDRVASEMSADVLVVGSSNKGWLRRLFGGSVSDYVAHHAPCPVMLIRHDL